jgi:hypothetical protein
MTIWGWRGRVRSQFYSRVRNRRLEHTSEEEYNNNDDDD